MCGSLRTRWNDDAACTATLSFGDALLELCNASHITSETNLTDDNRGRCEHATEKST